ncbi:MAG TPA: radical SAM family heme chaperone HemW [Candidatus Avidesulfovibrio excrementigallinarum]|nr:radical SAM family heme chaperone HemW [Candidatus Avidesulfovibrio excrementigallinarum]
MRIYVHVPFCRSKCRYCAFYSEPLHHAGSERTARYLTAIRDEWAWRHARLTALYSHAPVVTSVFFGGGTPSLLPAAELSGLLDMLRAALPFAPDTEITLEGNPESLIAPGKLATLARAGFNRLSMGAQSMDKRDLALLGRAHQPEDVRQAVRLAREAGFANVGVDLIWGLPGQSARAWLAQLQAVLELEPEHVSAYGLTLEPGTPLANDVARGVMSLPDEAALAEMYLSGCALLEQYGFEQYEISNFARPGFACRHNWGYWTGDDYLGIGPAAVSTLGRCRLSNPEDLDCWAARVSARVEPDMETLDETTVAEERAMLRLRTSAGLNLDEFAALAGRDLLAGQERFVQDLVNAGLARLEGRVLRLTRQGMLVSNDILSRLFEQIASTPG